MTYRLRALLLSSAAVLSACGGGGSGDNVESESDFVRPDIINVFDPVKWWIVPVPDFSDDPDRPAVTLIGEKYITLNLGDEYVESGATALDPQDGDISANVTIDSSQIDTSAEGTYIVRYGVTDSDDKSAIETLRFVRVNGNLRRSLGHRHLGTTQSHMGYLEYLPPVFAENPDQEFPLLIYIPGSGGNAEAAGFSAVGALKQIILVGGPPFQISSNQWDESLPFIVLSPQFGPIPDVTGSEQINSFVEFALATYPIDRDRVYMSGWSQGASLTLAYALNYPDKLAAMVSIASGISSVETAPDNTCDLENTPLWLFHGDNDNVIDVSFSINVRDVIDQRCQPQTAPRLTVFQNVNHFSHEGIFNLIFMENGSSGVTANSNYDQYDQPIHEWLLSHRLSDRGID